MAEPLFETPPHLRNRSEQEIAVFENGSAIWDLWLAAGRPNHRAVSGPVATRWAAFVADVAEALDLQPEACAVVLPEMFAMPHYPG